MKSRLLAAMCCCATDPSLSQINKYIYKFIFLNMMFLKEKNEKAVECFLKVERNRPRNRLKAF